MSKSQKELAFLRNLYVETDWTERFTDFFDDNYKLSDERNVLYINAGSGTHALALRKKYSKITEFRAISEDKELLSIAKAKADAVGAEVSFSTDLPDKKADTVLADASFVRPCELENFLGEIIAHSNKQIIFFLPTAGSFGDIFSFLWETFLNADLLEYSAEVERLISEIPTVSKVEGMCQSLGLTEVKTETKNEFFEFESGEEFINAPLVADFLFPFWLNFLDAKELKKVRQTLVKTIDNDRGELSFRFSVKMTLVSGEKNL